MKISVFYHHIERAAMAQGKTIPEMLAWCKELGINYIELDSKAIKNPKELSNLLTEYDIQVSSIYRSYDWAREPEEFYNFELLDHAKILNSSKVMVIPGLYTSEDEETQKAERQRMLEAMTMLCKRAENENLTVTIEDYDNNKSPISTIEGMKWFTDRIPSLKVTLDTGNFYYSGEDVLEASRIFADKIVHVHCKDRATSPNLNLSGAPIISDNLTLLYPCAVGQGCIPMRQCIEELINNGYDGSFVIEHFGIDDHFSAIYESAKWLKSL